MARFEFDTIVFSPCLNNNGCQNQTTAYKKTTPLLNRRFTASFKNDLSASAALSHMFLLTYTVFINLLPFPYYNAMDNPKPSERLTPLKRKNALWGAKLLEALTSKETSTG